MLATAIKPYKMPYSEHIPKGAIIKTLMWGMRTGGDVGALRTNKEESISNYSKEMYQHLYFVDDSDINEGDWYYWPVTRSVLRFKMTEIERKRDNPHPSKDCKKIIATTDKRIKNQMLLDGFDRILPQPSQSFIEEYCKQGGIDWVDVEYESAGNWINCKINSEKLGEECKVCNELIYASERDCDCGYKLKVNSNNKIITHFINDNWSRDKVETLLFNLADKYGYTSGKNDIEDFNQWIKKNL